MKYDCSKTADFIHEKNRMCDSNNLCAKCVLYSDEVDDCLELGQLNQSHVDAIQKWSDAHPEQTRLEKFMKLIEGTELENEFQFESRSFDKGSDAHHERLVSTHNKVWWSEVSE